MLAVLVPRSNVLGAIVTCCLLLTTALTIFAGARVATASAIDVEKARSELQAALRSGDADAILDALETAKSYDDPELAQLILDQALQHEDALVHKEGFETLLGYKSNPVRKVIADAAKESKRWEVRALAAAIVGNYGGEFSFGILKELTADKKWQVRSAAYRGFANNRTKRAVDFLLTKIESERGRLRADIVYALERITGEQFKAFQDWQGWWKAQREDFQIPTLDEIAKRDRERTNKDVKTAVRDGLYGPIYSERVAFLLDVSGSMTVGTEDLGSRIEIAQRELARVLQDGLSKDSQYNVIVFSDEAEAFHRRLQKAKPKAIEKDVESLQEIVAGGETNVIDALSLAFDDVDVDTIYLLSDGSPTRGEPFIPELILYKVEEWNRNRRVIINCIGFFPGTARNQDKENARSFLRALAEQNEGTYREIY